MQKAKYKKKFPAFTLFELVLVIAIAAIIFTVSASATVTYYRTPLLILNLEV
jgi:Tfp pilus assembly protein FimT